MKRDDIVTEAMDWLGTPYRHQGSLKGVGCDCLGLVRGVWRALIGPEPQEIPPYSPLWAEATGREQMREAADRHLVAIDVDAADRGDVLLFRWGEGHPAKHAAILTGRSRFIHAHDGAVVALAPLGHWWRARIAAAYRFPGLED